MSCPIQKLNQTSGSKNVICLWFQRLVNLFKDFFFWAELECIIKTIFYTQREQLLWGYHSCISKHPFTVQSQFLAIYKLRHRIASITKLHECTSHPGSLQFTNHLLAQTQCNAHYGLESTVLFEKECGEGQSTKHCCQLHKCWINYLLQHYSTCTPFTQWTSPSFW